MWLKYQGLTQNNKGHFSESQETIPPPPKEPPNIVYNSLHFGCHEAFVTVALKLMELLLPCKAIHMKRAMVRKGMRDSLLLVGFCCLLVHG